MENQIPTKEGMNLAGDLEDVTIPKPEINYAVDVSIEPNHECEIVEIKYDGQEIYKEPLTNSEYLAQLISKIDFFSENEEIAKQDDSINKIEVLNAKKFYQSIHERVKLSYDEVCVLLDCLSISRLDRLMSLEMDRKHLVSSSEEKPIDVSDKTLSLILKKKNIEKSKILLKKFIDKISQDNEYNSNKFHMELYRARQIWRIRKFGVKFHCDLSYRSVGCVNSMKATFELIKNDAPNQNINQKQQFLSVIVPEEFKDNFYIRVEIVKKSQLENVFDSKFSLFSGHTVNTSPLSWQETLEEAQNTIFCKEIYNQLLREVFDLSKNAQELRPIVIGNSIRMMITVEYDLVISLVSIDKNQAPPAIPSNYNFDNSVLEYFLHDLLKKYFEQNFFHYDQRPITSLFAYNSHVKIAGMAYVNLNNEEENCVINLPNSLNHLLNKKNKINLLRSIKEKAEHLIIRKKVLKILTRISREISEPHFYIEPCLWNNATSTDIRVTISSFYYDTLSKSSFFILIKKSEVNVLNRSSNMNLSFTDCVYNLRYYFIDQCCFHQTNLIVSLSQLFGWTILGSTFTNEQSTLIMSGAVLLCNDDFKKKIAVKICSINQIELYVFQYSLNKTDAMDLTEEQDKNWIYIKDNYTPINIDTYPGFTQTQKYELFLAQFSIRDCVQV